MSDIKDRIALLASKAAHPRDTVLKTIEKTGKKAIGCFPIYSVEELIYAAGMVPVGMWGGRMPFKESEKYLQSFCCSIMKENIELGVSGAYDMLSAVTIPSLCDTLKCVMSNWTAAVPHIPVVPLIFPQNRKSPAGIDYMRKEFRKIATLLEGISGKKITDKDLEDALAVFDDFRKTIMEFTVVAREYGETINPKVRHHIIKASYFLDKKDYTEELKAIIEGLKALPKEKEFEKKVVLTGLIAEPDPFLDLLIENEFQVVGDDLAQESRQFRTQYREGLDPIDKIVYRFVDQDGCAFLYDAHKSRGSKIINLVNETNAKGVIVTMMKFCDPEEFDYPIYKKELENAGIKHCYVELEQNIEGYENIRTRVQSFAEMI